MESIARVSRRHAATEHKVGLGTWELRQLEDSMKRPHIVEHVANNSWKIAGICHLKNYYATVLLDNGKDLQ